MFSSFILGGFLPIVKRMPPVVLQFTTATSFVKHLHDKSKKGGF